MTTTTTTVLERVTDDVFSDLELRTLAGFLGGYSGLTREAEDAGWFRRHDG